MNQSITNWFSPTPSRSTAPSTKARKKSTCVISTNHNTVNTETKKKSRKRKRKQSHHDSDGNEDHTDTQSIQETANNDHIPTQSKKRRKLNNTNSQKNTPKPQKNNLLSFLTPKASAITNNKHNKHNKKGETNEENKKNKENEKNKSNKKNKKNKKNKENKANKDNNKENNKENSTEQFSTSRYGRKRKKINYSLDSYWGATSSQNDEEYKIESDTRYSSEDDEYEAEPNKNKKKNKKKKKRKNSKTNAPLSGDKQKAIAETFFMNKSEKRQYKRDKVMDEFASEIARRHSEDARLFGGKKLNPFFEITKKRQEITNEIAKQKNKDSNYKHKEDCDAMHIPYFPRISSIKPVSNHRYTLNEEEFKIKCEDLLYDEFDDEMVKIEQQIADLCTRKDTNGNKEQEQNTVFKLKPTPIATATATATATSAMTPRYTHYWRSHDALNEYCSSSKFRHILHQISREYPGIDHESIKNELLMCLKRSVSTTDHGHNAQWCDKYKPLCASEVVGNWSVANELKSWLKAWTNADEKASYLESQDERMDDLYFSDDEWIPNNEYSTCNEISSIVVLTGPTACGKTASVHAVAIELEYNVIEVNCISICSAKDLNDQIGEATQSQQVKKHTKTIVLLEELDNMLESAPSIVGAITKFIHTSRCPIILTAQCMPLSLIRLDLTHFEFKHASLDRLSLRTYIIALCEGVCVTRNEIDKIVWFFDHDLRSVLIHLQFWLRSPRTFDHYNVSGNNRLPLPPCDEEMDVDDGVMGYDVCIREQMEGMHRMCIYQRIVGFADISFNSCNAQDCIFWSHFVSSKMDIKEANTNANADLNDDLYCFIQHILDSHHTNHIVFNSFPFWFISDNNTIYKSDNNATHCNTNPFSYSWTQSAAVTQANHVIQAVIDGMFEGIEHNMDIEMKQNEDGYVDNNRDNDKDDDMEWLQDWSRMIDALSNNDMLETPHGYCLNTSYHDRLHPHTSGIFDEALDVVWELIEKDVKCEIYDTIEHQYLKQCIAPYMVSMAIKMGAAHAHTLNEDKTSKFEPKLTDNLSEKQFIHNLSQYNIAESFRRHPTEGNFDFPTTKAWFEYYHEFISTVCINEYHREKKGNAQYRNGRAIRRSRRMKNTFFEHVLEGWLTKHQSHQIVQEWIDKFHGFGWTKNTPPTL